MMLLVHTPFSDESIGGEIGKSDYSYYFVMRAFLPALRSLGEVVEIRDPLREVDSIFHQCVAAGRDCVLLFFAPPHRIPLHLQCPVIPVFAWEYERIPDETWREERETDWSLVLAKLGWAITHSQYAVNAVRRGIRSDFPVVSVPAPIWDRHAASCARSPSTVETRRFMVDGLVLDSRTADLSLELSVLEAARPPGRQQVDVDGVVYTAIFCPLDGRKNWEDLLSAFCWACGGQADCTLVLKLVHHDRREAVETVLRELRRLPIGAARLLIVHAFLDDEQYGALMQATDFVVNSSLGEGQCLPLMEFMSAGVPAIAPRHTAMLDYLDESCGFPVRSFREWCNWPDDLRLVLRTRRHRPDWQALMEAYRASCELRRSDAPGYARMAAAARERQRTHCSLQAATDRLEEFLRLHAGARAAAGAAFEAAGGDGVSTRSRWAPLRDTRRSE